MWRIRSQDYERRVEVELVRGHSVKTPPEVRLWLQRIRIAYLVPAGLLQSMRPTLSGVTVTSR